MSLVLSGHALAEELFFVEKISVTARRSQMGAVKKILDQHDLREQREVTVTQIEKAKQALMNLQLFSDVKWTIKPLDNSNSEPRKNELQLQLEDRWTLIPIAKFSSGGGVKQTTLGAYDANFLGSLYEVGAQIERLENTNSGVAWLRAPESIAGPFGMDLQAWKTARLRTKYVQGPVAPEIKQGFLHQREKFYLELFREVIEDVRVGLILDSESDEFSERFVPTETKDINKGVIPEDSSFLTSGLRLRYNQLKYDSWQVIGSDLDLTSRRSLAIDGRSKSFTAIDGQYRFYLSPFTNHALALRVKAGGSNTNAVQYWNYFGGLSDIRGFVDCRFAGKNYWITNAEYRLPVMVGDSLVIQQVTFFDAVSAKDSPQDLSSASGASIGLGLRIIMPKIYRFTGRFDYAKPILRKDNIPISFGVQQFF